MEQDLAKTFFCKHYDRAVTRAECITLFIEDNFVRKESCIGQNCKSCFVICSACIEQKIKAPKRFSTNGHYYIDHDVENIKAEDLLCPFHNKKGKDAIFKEPIIPTKPTKELKKTSAGGKVKKITEKMAAVYKGFMDRCNDGEEFSSEISGEVRNSLDMKKQDFSNQLFLLRKSGLIKNISRGVNQIIYADCEIIKRRKKGRNKHVGTKSPALKASGKKSPAPSIKETTPTNNFASFLGLKIKPVDFGEMVDDRINEMLEASAVVCEEYAKEIRKRKR